MSSPIRVPIQRGQIRTDLGPVHYQSAGTGQPLVMIHGLSGSGRWWARNIQPFARHFRVLLVDLAGFGSNRRQRFALSAASQQLQTLLDRLEIHRCHLMGHSMGGFVATELAARRPELVDRLVLVDAAAVPIGRSLARLSFGLVEALRFLPLDFLPVLATDALRAGPVNLTRAILDLLRADLSADLSRIAADTCIIWGEHDTLLPLSLGERLHQAMPQARYVVIRGAGHNPMWDRPDEFNQTVLDFLLDRPDHPGQKGEPYEAASG